MTGRPSRSMSAWRRWLFLGLLLLIFPLAGCSVLIANTYMAIASHRGYEWDELVVPQTQQEVHAALGTPAQTFIRLSPRHSARAVKWNWTEGPEGGAGGRERHPSVTPNKWGAAARPRR